jgi:hypothetical protein
MRNEQNIRNQNPILIVKTSDDEGKPLISQMNEQVKIEGIIVLISDQDVVSKINTYFYIKSFFAGLTIFFFISFAIMTGLSGEPYLNYKRLLHN